MRKKKKYIWMTPFSCHQWRPKELRVREGIWRRLSCEFGFLVVCFYVFCIQDQAGCFEFSQENNESEEDIGRALTPRSTCFWDHKSPSLNLLRDENEVAGKVIWMCQMFKYWSKESSTQLLVQLASMAQNGTHNFFLQ